MLTTMERFNGCSGCEVESELAGASEESQFCAAAIVAVTWSEPKLRLDISDPVSEMVSGSGAVRSLRTDMMSWCILLWFQ